MAIDVATSPFWSWTPLVSSPRIPHRRPINGPEARDGVVNQDLIERYQHQHRIRASIRRQLNFALYPIFSSPQSGQRAPGFTAGKAGSAGTPDQSADLTVKPHSDQCPGYPPVLVRNGKPLRILAPRSKPSRRPSCFTATTLPWGTSPSPFSGNRSVKKFLSPIAHSARAEKT